MTKTLLFLFFLSTSAIAQITDASFFPNVKSINPGVVHMRRGGFVATDYSKKKIEKNHDVPLGGIVGGIQTDVDLTKKTFFAAAASRPISGEILLDQEDGVKTEKINSTTRGNRTTENNADSKYYGGMVDFRFFGISYASADYSYLNEFRVDTPPNLVARDEDKSLTYTNLKIGSAIKIGVIRVGAYFLNQKSEGSFTYTFYDPVTGNKGSTEKTDIETSTKGYGAGIGFTLPKLRSEISYETLYGNEIDYNKDYPGTVSKLSDASRITLVAEAHITFFSVGIRYRSIKGNYIDLEDIISANLLYDQVGEDDTRSEMSLNFSLGDSKGFSPSLFYTQSKTTTSEEDPIFDSGEKYDATTTSKAYGINLSYRF